MQISDEQAGQTVLCERCQRLFQAPEIPRVTERTAQAGDGTGPMRLAKGKHGDVPGWVWVVVIGVGSVLGVAFIVRLVMFWTSNGSDGPYPECGIIIAWLHDSCDQRTRRELQNQRVVFNVNEKTRELEEKKLPVTSYSFIGVDEWGKRAVDTSDPFSKEPKIHIWITYSYTQTNANKSSRITSKERFVIHKGKVIEVVPWG
jgi:hypothetical protein